MSTADKKERFHFLDGLRGIASFMIVIHHSFSTNIAHFFQSIHAPYIGSFLREFTQSGVELFFVLSGVVLLRPYVRGQRQFKTLDYLWRRVKRIYPPYFFSLVFASLVIWYMSMYPTWYNLRGMRTQFYWPETIKEMFIVSFNAKYYNLAWWSLQIEILFYALVPLIILVFPKPEKLTPTKIWVTILGTFAVGMGLQVLCNMYFKGFYRYDLFVLSFGKCLEYPVCFLMGIVLASKDLELKHAHQFLIAGLVLIIPGLPLQDYSLLFAAVIHCGYGLVYAAIVIYSFKLPSFKKFLVKPGMIWLGERSYSLFLIHFSVFYLVDNFAARFMGERNIMYGILTRGLGIPAALFMAMLLFQFVERHQARGLVTEKAFWPWQAKKYFHED